MKDVLHTSFTLSAFKDSLKGHWLTIMVCVLLSGVVTFGYQLLVPRYYRSSAYLLVEEKTSSVEKGLHVMGTVQGYKLGEVDNYIDAVTTIRYQDLLKSTEHLKQILSMQVLTQEGDSLDYFTYLQQHPFYKGEFQRFWHHLFPDKPSKTINIKNVDPFALTPEQEKIFNMARRKFYSVVVDYQVRISILDTDPYVCASLTGQITDYLKHFMTNYRVSKYVTNEQFLSKELDKAYNQYVKALQDYGKYAESHQDKRTPFIEGELQEKQNIMEERFHVYNAVWLQHMQSEALAQEVAPLFVYLRNPAVAVKPEGPKRIYATFMAMLLTFSLSLLFFLRKLIIKQF